MPTIKQADSTDRDQVMLGIRAAEAEAAQKDFVSPEQLNVTEELFANLDAEFSAAPRQALASRRNDVPAVFAGHGTSWGAIVHRPDEAPSCLGATVRAMMTR
ncbi:MAG: hypothetical protein ACR65Z_16185 [Methylocystis sp.]